MKIAIKINLNYISKIYTRTCLFYKTISAKKCLPPLQNYPLASKNSPTTASKAIN